MVAELFAVLVSSAFVVLFFSLFVCVLFIFVPFAVSFTFAVLSLKISELQVIADEIGENPILLLDDFMSELDEKRRNNFMENIKDTQVIITCTDKLLINDVDAKIFNVNNGEVFEEI